MIYYFEDNRWPWKDLFLCTCKGSSLSKIPVTAHVWICYSSSRDERGRILNYFSHQQFGTRAEAEVGKEEDSGPEPKSAARLPSSGQSEDWPASHSQQAAPCRQEQPLPASSLLCIVRVLRSGVLNAYFCHVYTCKYNMQLLPEESAEYRSGTHYDAI